MRYSLVGALASETGALDVWGSAVGEETGAVGGETGAVGEEGSALGGAALTSGFA
ncbi:hypothetical protein QNM97_17825 [Gordonia sp. L191]|uniref:hypothetical protein n=1 Tax=Gordonia sp. L191 TaxID=2982699 RepID=UPI0024BF6179|nr:hypothetical protein [Gordonia sp. L191]WHU45853.1 hypothetical protein QNM97_17825 [Gordonia sp. L191]